MVTAVPFVSLNLGFYKHVGVELKLYPKTHRLTYSQPGNVVLRYWRNSLYKHFGVELKLYPKTHRMTYSQLGNVVQRYWRNSLFANISPNAARNHGPAEYDQRLELTKPVLEKLYLNDRYDDYLPQKRNEL
jgi:hypothetical protein